DKVAGGGATGGARPARAEDGECEGGTLRRGVGDHPAENDDEDQSGPDTLRHQWLLLRAFRDPWLTRGGQTGDNSASTSSLERLDFGGFTSIPVRICCLGSAVTTVFLRKHVPHGQKHGGENRPDHQTRSATGFCSHSDFTTSKEVRRGLCRKVAFWKQNPKMGSQKINDLGASTFLFSVICDRADDDAIRLSLYTVWYRLARQKGRTQSAGLGGTHLSLPPLSVCLAAWRTARRAGGRRRPARSCAHGHRPGRPTHGA